MSGHSVVIWRWRGSGSLWTGFSLSPLSLLSLCLATRPTSSSFRPCFLQRNLSYYPGTVSQYKTPFTLVAFGWGYPITETKMPITRGGSRTAAVRMASSVYTSPHLTLSPSVINRVTISRNLSVVNVKLESWPCLLFRVIVGTEGDDTKVMNSKLWPVKRRLRDSSRLSV